MRTNKQIKAMIESLTPPCDEFYPYPVLPWRPHPLSYCWGEEFYQKDTRILRKVERTIGKEAFQEVKGIIKDFEGGYSYEITRTRGGDEETYDIDDLDYAKGVWHEQQSVGYEGDSWSGTTWIQITSKRFLRFDWNM